MKNYSTKIVLLIIPVLALSACNNNSSADNPSQTPTQKASLKTLCEVETPEAWKNLISDQGLDTSDILHTVFDIAGDRIQTDKFFQENRGVYLTKKDGTREKLFTIEGWDAIPGAAINDDRVAIVHRMGDNLWSPVELLLWSKNDGAKRIDRSPIDSDGRELASPMTAPLLTKDSVLWMTSEENKNKTEYNYYDNTSIWKK
ncbi:MAG: hypothetical protein ACRDAX_02305 [Propionibacteriaceae bacterium]